MDGGRETLYTVVTAATRKKGLGLIVRRSIRKLIVKNCERKKGGSPPK